MSGEPGEAKTCRAGEHDSPPRGPGKRRRVPPRCTKRTGSAPLLLNHPHLDPHPANQQQQPGKARNAEAKGGPGTW
jgi:hypothetical protein